MTKPDILYLHAGLSSSAQWASLAETHPGTLNEFRMTGCHGPFDPSRPWLIDDECAVIRPRRPTVICGHSYGAAVALALAAKHPDLVQALCLFEPVCFGVLPADSPHKEYLRNISTELMQRDLEDAACYFTGLWSGNPDGAYRLPASRREMLAQNMRWVLAGWEDLVEYRVDYTKLRCPIRMIKGLESPAILHAVFEEVYHRLPQAEVLEVRTGHMGPIDSPDTVIPLFAAFLERQLGQA